VTQVTNSSLPLVFAALGQSFVVLTRGLDLSVGGTISLSTAVTAQMMSDSPGSILLWSAVVLVMGAVIGLVNGLLVARARLAPILVTLATLSILQGLAIFVLPKPGGLVPRR
jgi:ribose transport system permease protein